MTIRALAARAVAVLLLACPVLHAQEPPRPPEPPEPPSIEVDVPDVPGKKEFSLKAVHVRAGETRRGNITAIAPMGGSIEGTLDGDLWLTGGPLRISGNVTGDVFYAGSQLDITGKIERSIRAASGNVVIDGEVGGNVVAPSGSLVLGSKAHIKGNVSCLGGQLVHHGVIDGTLEFTGGNLVLGGKVGEDAEIEADSIQIEKGGRVEGDVEYTSRNRIDDELKAIAGGDVEFNERPNLDHDEEGEGNSGGWVEPPSKTSVGFTVAFFLASYLFGCALIALFGGQEPKVVAALRDDTLRCAGLGFVSFLVTIAVCLSMILLLTIPFVLIYLVLYIVAMYLAKVPVALWLGRMLLARLNRTTGPYLALLVGLVPIYVVFAIPYIRYPAYVAVVFLGLGAMITTYISHREAKKAALGMPPAGGSPAETPLAS